MITKTGLEKIDRILKKSGKKVDGFFSSPDCGP